MYLFLKKIVKKIFPQKILFKTEPFLRKAFSLFFIGKKYHCAVCEGSFSRFIALKNGELLCVRCGSLPRDRRLYDLLKKENLMKGRVLDFSPSRALYRKFKKNPHIEYFSSDFAHEFISDYQFDITDIIRRDQVSTRQRHPAITIRLQAALDWCQARQQARAAQERGARVEALGFGGGE